MGKPKLGVGSSIKALLKGPKTMTLVCVQQGKTDSFREVYKNFNSMYYTSSSSTATTTISSSMNEEESADSPLQRALTIFPGEESFSASCCSSSSRSAETSYSDPAESLPKEAISTQRFFFSPCTTKSIMEVEDHPQEEEEKAFLKDLCFETGKEKAEEEEAGFCKESVTLAMASENPYMDFRSSMEEMVAAHGLSDWSCLQELLQCYLRLNEKETHKIIVLAFVDLLMNLVQEDPKEGKVPVESHCPPCLCLDEEMKDKKGVEQQGKEER